MLNIIVGKNPRNTGNLPCLTSLCTAESQTAEQNSDPNPKQSHCQDPKSPPQNTFMTVKADYLWNLRLIPDKTPAEHPAEDQWDHHFSGIGMCPWSPGWGLPTQAGPTEGKLCLAHPSVLLHIHRHWFSHTKPSSCYNSFATPPLCFPGCCCHPREVIHS